MRIAPPSTRFFRLVAGLSLCCGMIGLLFMYVRTLEALVIVEVSKTTAAETQTEMSEDTHTATTSRRVFEPVVEHEVYVTEEPADIGKDAQTNLEQSDPTLALSTSTADLVKKESATSSIGIQKQQSVAVIDEVESAEADAPLSNEETKAVSYVEAVMAELLVQTNETRSENGVPILVAADVLIEIATLHSADMAARNYFSHESPEGCRIKCRLDGVGYTAKAWGENIAWRNSSILSSPEEQARWIVSGWLNSPGHRRNLLSSSYTRVGHGVALQGNKLYVTAVYTRPR